MAFVQPKTPAAPRRDATAPKSIPDTRAAQNVARVFPKCCRSATRSVVCAALDFESAALYRDQISTLKQMQAHQFVAGRGADIDFVALVQDSGLSCVQVVSVRGGRNLGQRNHFPSQAEGCDAAEVMEAFLGQYYQERHPPAQIVMSHQPLDAELRAFIDTIREGGTPLVTGRIGLEAVRVANIIGEKIAQCQ